MNTDMYDEELQYILKVADVDKIVAHDAVSKQIVVNPIIMGYIVQYAVSGCRNIPVGTLARWLYRPLSLLKKYGLKIDSMVFMKHEDKPVLEGLITYDVLFKFFKQNNLNFENIADNTAVDENSATNDKTSDADEAFVVATAAAAAAQKTLEKATAAATVATAARDRAAAIAAADTTTTTTTTIEAANDEALAATKAAERAAAEAVAAAEAANRASDAADDARWGNSMIINVELQRKFNPGYWLLNRCIYYVSRMMSRQSGTEFANIKYDEIKRVYSIWICLNPPDGLKNRGKLYTFHEQDLDNLPGYFVKTLKVLNIVLIGVQGPDADNYQGIFRLLDTLFTSRYNWKEKLEILEKEFGFEKLPSDFVERLKIMSELGLSIFQEGMAEGEARGEARGKAEGKAELASQMESIANKIIAGASIDDALTSSNVSEKDYPTLRNLVSLFTAMRK